MLKLTLSLLAVALLVAPLALAQEMEGTPAAPAAPKPVRKVDPAAQKLIDASMKHAYSAVAAGLKEMTCTVTLNMPQGAFNFAAKFVAPDTTTAKVTGLPPEMEAYAPMLEQQFGKMIQGLFGDQLKGPYADVEKYNLSMKEGTTNVVVQTKFAADAESERVEITFGEDGLPIKIANTTVQGEAVIVPEFKKVDDKYVMAKAKMNNPMAGEVVFATDWQKVGKFWVVSKVELTTAMGGIKLAATDIKVKPAAEATATPVEPGK
jgi:hypothetical protein